VWQKEKSVSVRKIEFIFFFFISLSLCSFSADKTEKSFYGLASWYGGGEPLNEYTANGEIFNPYYYTCATRTFPFGSRLKITNLSNGRSVIVRVNDRGPADWLPLRVVDLTKQAFREIEDLNKGLTYVQVEVITGAPAEGKTEEEIKYELTKEINAIVKEEIKNIFKEVQNEVAGINSTRSLVAVGEGRNNDEPIKREGDSADTE